MEFSQYTVKKGLRISRPQPGCLQARSKLKLFPPRESLISDIPAGDRKTALTFIYSVFRGIAEFRVMQR